MVLGLPSKDYFLKPGSKKDRDAYLKLMVDIAILMGADEVSAKREMEKVLLFEIYLANVCTKCLFLDCIACLHEMVENIFLIYRISNSILFSSSSFD